MKQYRVTMPDGTIWDTPVSAIARNHAEYYAQYETGGDVEKCLKEHSLPLLLENPMEVWEWACGNMDWADAKPSARLVSGVVAATDADYQDEWVNGNHKVVDVDDAEITPSPTVVPALDDSGWVNVVVALPVLERIPACRAGRVEVAELGSNGEWIFAQLYAPNVQLHETAKTFWRYLPDAPDLVA
jgi:hypothetical protein